MHPIFVDVNELYRLVQIAEYAQAAEWIRIRPDVVNVQPTFVLDGNMLHWSRTYNSPAVVTALLKTGIDPNHEDLLRRTALDVLCISFHPSEENYADIKQSARILLDYGARCCHAELPSELQHYAARIHRAKSASRSARAAWALILRRRKVPRDLLKLLCSPRYKLQWKAWFIETK